MIADADYNLEEEMKPVYISCILLGLAWGISAQAAPKSINRRPVAGVRPSVYVEKYVRVGPTESYDPDGDPLHYTWQQTAGPDIPFSWHPVTGLLIIDGLEKTNNIQGYTFQVFASDGQLTSEPATLKVVVVADYEDQRLTLHGRSRFDPNLPTILAFGAGNGSKSRAWVSDYNPWLAKVNWYSMDTLPPYHRIADFMIKELSKAAPTYHQPIQTLGFSSGAVPAIEVAKRLNFDYGDALYMVNRVTLLDAIAGTKPKERDLHRLSHTVIDDETCWIDTYTTGSLPGIFNTHFRGAEHFYPLYWYEDSHKPSYWPAGIYNNGITSGYYISVAGPGKNLHVPYSDPFHHFFQEAPGAQHLILHNEQLYPGHLPEPVTLLEPAQVIDTEEVLLTCRPSAHAVRYESLTGPNLDRVCKYDLVAEANEPPTLPLDLNSLPYESVWATVRARTAFDVSIYADPVRLDHSHWPIENISLGLRHLSLEGAIEHAIDGDTLMVPADLIPDESIDYQGKNLLIEPCIGIP